MIYKIENKTDIFEKRDGCIVLHRIFDNKDLSIGSIHKSNNCGLFKIIDYDNNIKKFKVQFLITKYEKYVLRESIITGKVKDQTLLQYLYINKRYKCNCGNTCMIISYAGTLGGYQMYDVIFDNTNYKTTARIGNITRGKVKDPLYPSEQGIGYLGIEHKNFLKKDKKLYNVLYNRWRCMISRCYNSNDHKYNIYGGNNVTVCEQWHNLSNYLYDVITLNGYNRNDVIHNKLQLDKDKYQQNCNKKIYSPETCCWLTNKEQCMYIKIALIIKFNDYPRDGR